MNNSTVFFCQRNSTEYLVKQHSSPWGAGFAWLLRKRWAIPPPIRAKRAVKQQYNIKFFLNEQQYNIIN